MIVDFYIILIFYASPALRKGREAIGLLTKTAYDEGPKKILNVSRTFRIFLGPYVRSQREILF
ncbi:hypothetical protein B0D78_11240 [Pyramidobacter sp. C12-8]|nr:hypothetical protein B0D78_11240 [Pyramidobacter sp. C12-8]